MSRADAVATEARAASAAPLVSVCVLTYNRCALLEPLLRELLALRHRPLEILVVDNDSRDGTRAMVTGAFPQVRYLRNDRNLGAAGRNRGMHEARGEIVVTLDDDVRGLDDADLRALLRAFDAHPRAGAINFRVTNDAGGTCNWVHHCKAEEFEHRTFLTYELTEGAVAFRKAALERAGYYPDDFFLSHEGPDLAFRLFEQGFEVLYAGDVAVCHGFAQEGREPWRNHYYDTRNQFWLAARNFPARYAARYLARGLAATLVYSLRDGYLRWWLKAVVDGLAGLRGVLRQRRVLSAATMEIVGRIDAQRPGLLYMARKRLAGADGLLMK